LIFGEARKRRTNEGKTRELAISLKLEMKISGY
jgi:hypothetical protein